MASVFVDEAYENLDPISQMVEPFWCPVLDFLNLIPDEIKLSVEDSRALMFKLINRGETYIRLPDVIEIIFPKIDVELIKTIKDVDCYRSALQEFLNTKIIGQFSWNVTTGDVLSDCEILISKRPGITELNIINFIIDEIAIDICVPAPSAFSKEDLVRIKDLAEILDANIVHSGRRSASYWRSVISTAFVDNIKSNQWRVRSSEAMFEIVSLINNITMCTKNWHTSKINLIHAKAIARSNKPIYKIVEL